MTNLREVCTFLEAVAPSVLAEEWDNVGLLAGDDSANVERVMTCLTITPATAAEAVRERADLIVTHHPLPFRPVKRLTAETTPGKLLWQLVSAGVAIYSGHTAFDSSGEGINQQWAAGLDLQNVQPLLPTDDPECSLGAGRWGVAAGEASLADLADQVKQFLSIDHLRLVGDPAARVKTIAIACGSGGTFLPTAAANGCDVLITGETTFHGCLEAEAQNIALILPGHYASERFAMESLAGQLSETFIKLSVWASADERDPLIWR